MRALSFFFLLLSLVSKAQKQYPFLLDQYMQAQVRVNDFSGAVLVAKKDRIFMKKHSA
jgi:hypothetical protein